MTPPDRPAPVRIEEQDAGDIMRQLRRVSQQRGGVGHISAVTGLARGNLYRILDDGGNPQLKTLLEIVEALGMRLQIVDIEGDEHG